MFFIEQAHAQAAGGAPQGGAMVQLAVMVGIVLLMWFVAFRPQQKRAKEHRNMVAALKKGDEVITNGGLMGRIVALDEQAINLEIAKGTVVRFQRQFVSQVLPKGSLKGEGVAAGNKAGEDGRKSDS